MRCCTSFPEKQHAGGNQIKLNGQSKRFRFITILFLVDVVLLGCQTAVSTPTPPPHSKPESAAIVESQPISDGPILLRDNISLRKIADIGFGGIKLAQDPQNGELYYLQPAEGIFHVALTNPIATNKVVDIRDVTAEGLLAGMVFGSDGTLYVVVNSHPSDVLTQAAIYKGGTTRHGAPRINEKGHGFYRFDGFHPCYPSHPCPIYKGAMIDSGGFTWETMATTEPYPASNTNFDHLFNGIAVSADNQWVFVSSGSRTDHGEVEDTDGSFPDVREVALTSAVLRIPADGVDLIVPNDEAALSEQSLLYADGTRNAYDLAFAPNGDLFGVDNGPDADYPDELNWIREGKHYGFPWRFGSQDNPQQFADYDASQDKRLSQDFVAVQGGTYQNDPGFPPPPQVFTNPIVNLGPDAAQYRDDNGRTQDAAANGETLTTFTPHRSPLGLVFLTDPQLPGYLQSQDEALSAFVLSWGAAGGDLSDQGQDLLHLMLTKDGDNYTAVTTQIARGFKRPIDAVMIENRLYVLEWEGAGTIWELTFE